MKKETIKNRVSAIFLISLITLLGCDKSNEITAADSERLAAEQAQRDAIEKEAHASPHEWYLIKIGKYDGECIRIDGSARSNADSYNSYATLDDAKKSENDYTLSYTMMSPFYRKTYTTSYEWCRSIINATIQQHNN